MEQDKYYLKKEIPYILECSTTTADVYVNANRLTKVKAGPSHSSRVYFLKSEVDKLKKELRLERLNRKKFRYEDIVNILKLLNTSDEWIEKNIK